VTPRRASLREAAVVATATGRSLTLPETADLINTVLDVARVAFGAAACSVAELDPVSSELVYRSSVGEGAAETIGLRLPLGQGVAGYAAASGETIAVDDVTHDARFARDVAERTGYVPRSILAAPIMRDDDVLGVFSVLDRTQPAGTAALDLAARCARSVGGALTLGDAARSIGAAVLDSVAIELRAERPDVAATLTALARDDHAADDETARIVAALAAARRLGTAERNAAGRMLEEFLAYARARRGRR